MYSKVMEGCYSLLLQNGKFAISGPRIAAFSIFISDREDEG